jgi:chaperonin GroES
MKKDSGSKTHLLCVHDNILVKVMRETDGDGAVVPTSDRPSELKRGTVRSVGEYGKMTLSGATVPNSVKEGDTVLFNDMRGQEVRLNGETLVVVKEEWVVGVLSES